jgi:hypothetical protein
MLIAAISCADEVCALKSVAATHTAAAALATRNLYLEFITNLGIPLRQRADDPGIARLIHYMTTSAAASMSGASHALFRCNTTGVRSRDRDYDCAESGDPPIHRKCTPPN